MKTDIEKNCTIVFGGLEYGDGAAGGEAKSVWTFPSRDRGSKAQDARRCHDVDYELSSLQFGTA